MRVPRFFFARIASTTPSGFKIGIQLPWGSASTGIIPRANRSRAWAAVSVRWAVTSSTVARSRGIAWEKHTVRRMAVGRSRSVITT